MNKLIKIFICVLIFITSPEQKLFAMEIDVNEIICFKFELEKNYQTRYRKAVIAIAVSMRLFSLTKARFSEMKEGFENLENFNKTSFAKVEAALSDFLCNNFSCNNTNISSLFESKNYCEKCERIIEMIGYIRAISYFKTNKHKGIILKSDYECEKFLDILKALQSWNDYIQNQIF